MIIFQQFDQTFSDIRDITVPHNKSYCEKYGIEYRNFVTNDIGINCQKYWNKIIIAYQQLQLVKDDWILMLDGDAILVPNNNVEIITKIISPNRDIGICRVTDDLEQYWWNINIGSVFFRNTNFVRNILKDMILYAEKVDYKIYEQQVLQEMLKKNYNNILEKTENFSSIAFNHTGGPFVFHPCGKEDTTTNNKEQAIKNKIMKLKKEIEKIS